MVKPFFVAAAALFVLVAVVAAFWPPVLWSFVVLLPLFFLGTRDALQTRHAVLRNFPVIGHFRYLLESVGPELRQYIVTDNDEERPFSRDHHTWVYASAKRQNNYFGFGTDNDLELTPNYLILKHSAFPKADPHPGQPGYDAEYRPRSWAAGVNANGRFAQTRWSTSRR